MKGSGSSSVHIPLDIEVQSCNSEHFDIDPGTLYFGTNTVLSARYRIGSVLKTNLFLWTGFDMPTIYIPNPNRLVRCVNQIEDVCKVKRMNLKIGKLK